MIYAKVLDTTVEADFRRAFHSIELGQMPLSDQPVSAVGWPTQSTKIDKTIDNFLSITRKNPVLRSVLG